MFYSWSIKVGILQLLFKIFGCLSHKRELSDEGVKEIVLKAFNFKNRKKGARQIKMTLEDHFGIVYNLKRIRRIMKKYAIICSIRAANMYKRMAKATKEHRVVPNLLQRRFKQNTPCKVLLTVDGCRILQPPICCAFKPLGCNVFLHYNEN